MPWCRSTDPKRPPRRSEGHPLVSHRGRVQETSPRSPSCCDHRQAGAAAHRRIAARPAPPPAARPHHETAGQSAGSIQGTDCCAAGRHGTQVGVRTAVFHARETLAATDLHAFRPLRLLRRESLSRLGRLGPAETLPVTPRPAEGRVSVIGSPRMRLVILSAAKNRRRCRSQRSFARSG